ncbi:MAG: hypothetical protein NTW75_06990 [Planctomycetales bacterium]|nr:hypothetical protein [Planctomycetales bacterium]
MSLTPPRGSWDGGMIGHPCVLHEQDRLRLFYKGASSVAMGIGMAPAKRVE